MHRSILDNFVEFRAYLDQVDFSALPGLEAQLRMAPRMRHRDISSKGEGRDPVLSSVLCLLYPLENGKPGMVLIQRPEYEGAHSGQISFPGGRYEVGDPDMMHTALRETREEIGIDPSAISIIGKLTDLFIPPSNFIVFPYVGIAEKRPLFSPDPEEVAAIIEVEVASFFLDENCLDKTLTLRDGYRIHTPCYVINGHIIWGATAMMIAEFLDLVKVNKKSPV